MDQSTLKYYSDNAAQVAERYESVVSNLSAHFADSFNKSGKILDIGCGSGRDLAVLHKLGFDCYGVDPTPEFVAIAQRIHSELVGQIALGELPDLKTPFYGLLCPAVIIHINNEQLPTTATPIKSCLTRDSFLYCAAYFRLNVTSTVRLLFSKP
jgi:2-polyprenyl-3-methyl-5-hydroxy-6-metoxy-1,4-benzoquinol methylase